MIICCSGGHAFGQSHCCPLSHRVVAAPPGPSSFEHRSAFTAASASASVANPAHNGVKQASDS
eukprot:4245986-Pleurochrysis_carterae.AAC.1